MLHYRWSKAATNRPASCCAVYVVRAMLVRSPCSGCTSPQEGAVLVQVTIVVCLSMLSMFSMVWMARHAAGERSVAVRPDADQQPPLSPTEKRLWLIGWVLSALPCFGLVVTEWRYYEGWVRVGTSQRAAHRPYYLDPHRCGHLRGICGDLCLRNAPSS
jgi:hypothetical protein